LWKPYNDLTKREYASGEIKMKINQVAELVGITKKNIRFYEEQKLVEPGRDSQNGYREYSMDDVRQLEKVKLLRQLGVSCESIRKMEAGELGLERCMKDRLKELEEAEQSIGQMKILCLQLAEKGGDYTGMDAAAWLERMKELEKGGGKFMNVEKTDTRKRKTGAIIAAAVVVLFAIAMIAMLLWANKMDPAPKAILIFCLAVLGAVIIGVIIAVIQRLKEVKGGEIDEARKY
jgi:DNA-binding transcriptional MerR regulator